MPVFAAWFVLEMAQAVGAPNSDDHKECVHIKTGTKICTQALGVRSVNNSYSKCYRTDCKYADTKKKFGYNTKTSLYSEPIGFTRISLKRDFPKDVFSTKYHKSYHGVPWKVATKIIAGGYKMLKSGDYINRYKQLLPPKNHYQPNEEGLFIKPKYNPYTKQSEHFDIARVFTSPSIHYAAHRCYARVGWVAIDTNSNSPTVVQIRFVFEIHQKADEYERHCETLGAFAIGKVFDEYVPNDVIEWATKTNENVIITGILLQIKQVASCKSVYEELNLSAWIKTHDMRAACKFIKKSHRNFYIEFMGSKLGHSTQYQLKSFRKSHKWCDSDFVCSVKHCWGMARFNFFVDFQSNRIYKIHEFNLNDNSVAE